MHPILLITNSEAGSSDAGRLDAALTVLRERTDVEVSRTANPGELDGVLHRAGSRHVVVAGGDGSLHAVVAALHRRHDLQDSVLGLIPLGTGNDFARGTGIPLDPAAAAGALLDGTPRSMDLMVDELGEIVVNGVHVGTGALASRHGARVKDALGKAGLGKIGLSRLGYPIGAAIAALRPQTIRLRIEVDGELVSDLDRTVLMVALGNGSQVGGGTELTPGANPGDSQLDVMISYAVTPTARLGYLTRLVRGSHHGRDDVVTLRGTRVAIAGEQFWCSADGEVYGPERQRGWHLEAGAWSLIVPR